MKEIFLAKKLLLGTCVVSICVKSVMCTSIKIGIILMESAPEPFDLRRIGPAIDIAMEEAVNSLGVRFEPVYKNYSGDSVCSYEVPVGLLAELYSGESVQGVIGPACSQGLLSSGRLAQYLKLPIVTGLGDLVIRKDNVDMFKTLTIMSYNLQKLSCKYISINLFGIDF